MLTSNLHGSLFHWQPPAALNAFLLLTHPSFLCGSEGKFSVSRSHAELISVPAPSPLLSTQASLNDGFSRYNCQNHYVIEVTHSMASQHCTEMAHRSHLRPDYKGLESERSQASAKQSGSRASAEFGIQVLQFALEVPVIRCILRVQK